jgi:LmbE family N-acetylglucosaminyl deacetylase
MLNKEQPAVPTASHKSAWDDELAWKFSLQERILVLAPHPDDEILAAGGIIATTLKLRPPSAIRVVVATNGEASYATAFFHGSHLLSKRNFKRLAVRRQQESLSALIFLGLSLEQIHFWGFPDRGLASIWQHHWDAQQPYRSPTTGYDQCEQALNSLVMPFTGAGLLQLIQKELSEFQPTAIILPHPKDAHPDHSALANFTLLAAGIHYSQQRQPSPRLLAYMMWAGNKPWLTGVRPHDITSQPGKREAASTGWQRLTMHPNIRDQKALALKCYRSQNFSAGQLLRDRAQSIHEVFVLLKPYSVIVER